MQTLTRAFDGYLSRRNRAAGTRVKYGQHLAEFAAWAGEREIDSITAQDIEFGFLAEWREAFIQEWGREPSPHALRNKLQALRSFYAFCERFDFIGVKNPMAKIDAVEVPARANDWLRDDEDARLLDASMNEQERIVIYFLRFTGLRVGEATSLMDADVGPDSITVRVSKTARGRRVIPLLPELVPHVERWRAMRGQSGPFLATRNGTPMAEQHIQKLIRRVALQAGVRDGKVSPHTLRRTFGSWLLNKGVRLEAVSALLGHANTTITERAYAELLDATIRQEVMAALG